MKISGLKTYFQPRLNKNKTVENNDTEIAENYPVFPKYHENYNENQNIISSFIVNPLHRVGESYSSFSDAILI